MTISFHEASVETYSRILDATAATLEKGAAYAKENDKDLSEFVQTKLRDDMMPLHFQVVSTCHHALGALKGMQEGRFAPPSFELDKDYQGLQALVDETRQGVAAFSEQDVDAFADKSLTFVLGKNEIPFTNQNFLLSFSLPNFYFHATTTYDILRMLGVPLGKRDFIGAMKMG